jgi:hypothetical protein
VYFKVLKSGCRIEQLQLETRERLQPALAFYMIIAWRVLFLTMLGRECPETAVRHRLRRRGMAGCLLGHPAQATARNAACA